MTSGTTGVPKAVEHHHRNVGMCAEYYEQVLGCTKDDRLFATSRFHFAYAIGNMFAALRMGAGNILLERWATAPSVAETVERFKPTRAAQRAGGLSSPARSGLGEDRAVSRAPPFRLGRRADAAADLDRVGGRRRPSDPRRARLLGMRLHDHRQHAGAPQSPARPGEAMPSVELRIVDDAGAVIGASDTPGRLEVRMPSICEGYRSAGDNLDGRRSGRPSSSGRTAGSRPATNISATPTASIITAAAPATCCGCRASGCRRRRSRMRSPVRPRSPRARRCWARATSGSPRSCFMSCRRPAPITLRRPARRASAFAGAAALQAAAALRGGRRSAAHRDRQGAAPQAARACCGAIIIEAGRCPRTTATQML